MRPNYKVTPKRRKVEFRYRFEDTLAKRVTPAYTSIELAHSRGRKYFKIASAKWKHYLKLGRIKIHVEKVIPQSLRLEDALPISKRRIDKINRNRERPIFVKIYNPFPRLYVD